MGEVGRFQMMRKRNFMITLSAATTALILIDLQKGIVAYQLAPYSSEAVLAKGKELARRFRVAKAPVVLVNVAFAPDGGDALTAPVERPMQAPPGGFPEDWSELADGLAEGSDLKVTKRQWGAFYGTELDLQLRRRHIRTIVLGGVATQIGVESTARQAYEHGYELLIVKDATTSSDAEGHEMSMKHIMPRLGRIVQSGDITLTRG
jgi:nicotinamidase-related amidase